ncbi:MAG: bacillithiol biosynthesis cysteine-adding enzyme BshC, partial [bacterium]
MSDTLDLNLIPGLPRIFADYVLNFDRVRGLYRWDYRSIDSVSSAGVSCRSGFADRREIKPILLEQNKRFSDDKSVMENIEKLCDGGCAVVTGQQIGLFCGPLYTLYKAATAIRLAEELNRKGPDQHVPIFWMECEDHDILEVGHVHILDSAHRVLTLTAYETPGRRPTGSYQVDERVKGLIEQLKTNSQASQYLDIVLQLIEDSYKPNTPLSEGFGRLMAALFRGKGLVIVDPRDPAVKRLTSRVYVRAVREWSQLNQAISDSSARLKELGYEPQIRVEKKHPPFFLIEDERRVQLSWEGDVFIGNGGETRITQSELASIAAKSPEQLSPNVSLRPLIQDHLFLTIAYIAGPGEISYFPQIAPLYQILNMDMPAIFPRAGMTLVEPVVRRIIEKLGAEVIDFFRNEKDLAEMFLAKAGA